MESPVQAEDLVELICKLGRLLREPYTGKFRNHSSRIRSTKRDLLKCVAVHKGVCDDCSCKCKRLIEFCPVDVATSVPDLFTCKAQTLGQLVVYPQAHSASCRATWDRTAAPFYCMLSCESKPKEGAVGSVDELLSSTGETSEAANDCGRGTPTAHLTAHAQTNRNDCGCEKAGARIFREAAVVGFRHDPDPEKCMNDVIAFLLQKGGLKRKRV